VVEIRSPPVQTSGREFGVFQGTGCEPRQVPARGICLSDYDDANAFAWPEIERLGGSEEPILVQRFDGTHDPRVAQGAGGRSRAIQDAWSAQRTAVKLRPHQ